MNKYLTLLLIIVLSPFVGGIYGIIHDQLTCTISPEYYTRFKFEQFGIDAPENYRVGVAVVGFCATWWVALPLGAALAVVGLIHINGRVMLRVTIKAFIIAMLIAFATGLVGLFYGEFLVANNPPGYFSNWYLPDSLVDFKNFVAVGMMHNFSYAGGLVGFIAGLIYTIREKTRLEKTAGASYT